MAPAGPAGTYFRADSWHYPSIVIEMEMLMVARRTLVLSAVAALALSVAPALADSTRLNPNSASTTQLTGLGLDAALAKAITDNRPYATMLEFNQVVRQTLSADQAAGLYQQLWVPVNLNTGSRDEIALIPGMSRRMIREFLEYRPYTGMDEFNKEIGKYVDDAEVARLRSYVTL